MSPEEVTSILEKHHGSRGALISVLEDIQHKYGYLPADALRAVAEQTRRSLVDIYGVATFYRSFTLTPRGKHHVCACVGTACHVRGAPNVVKELQHQLGVQPGTTTPDREFSLETVNCVGACALGPMVIIDGHYNSKVAAPKVRPMLDRARAGSEGEDVTADERIFPLNVSCPRCHHSLMDPEHPIDNQPSIRVEASMPGARGWVRLSSLYGSYHVSTEHELPVDAVVPFHCPHCHEELKGFAHCPVCDAPMTVMIVDDAGVLQICSRRGCREHVLDLDLASVSNATTSSHALTGRG